ncbi:MAG TPA: YdcF family protein [Vicinamibacterales bacterium]|nr:YdcF family protein [Vicinamibacterales bacterium]
MKRTSLRLALILGAVLLIAAYPFARLGSWLVVEDPLQKADAIVVLGGTMYERPLGAVDLFHAGYAPRIYLLREAPDYGEAEIIRRGLKYPRLVDVQIDALIRLGVPREAVGVLEPSNSTADEAMYVRDLVIRERLARVIVITSKQHTRRARMVLNRRLRGTGGEVIMRATPYDRSNVDRWWASRSTMRFTLFESQRLFAYWIGVAD